MIALLKSHVFSWLLKTFSDIEFLIVVGSKFHKVGAEMKKEQPPQVLRLKEAYRAGSDLKSGEFWQDSKALVYHKCKEVLVHEGL